VRENRSFARDWLVVLVSALIAARHCRMHFEYLPVEIILPIGFAWFSSMDLRLADWNEE